MNLQCNARPSSEMLRFLFWINRDFNRSDANPVGPCEYIQLMVGYVEKRKHGTNWRYRRGSELFFLRALWTETNLTVRVF